MLKSEKGFTGVDVSVSIIAIIIFTSTILSLMYNVKMENAKIEGKILANIYLTETLENIGIANYDDVTTNNAKLLPKELPEAFKISVDVSKLSEEDTTKTEDIIKKVNVKISYTFGKKTYEENMQRLKIKE